MSSPLPSGRVLRARPLAAKPPPRLQWDPVGWIGRRLFNGWQGALLTVILAYGLWRTIPPIIDFLFVDAVWFGESREDCLSETLGRPTGACWPFVRAKLGQFVYGFYPVEERWRVNLVFAFGIALLGPLLIPSIPRKRLNALLFFLVYPAAATPILLGGVFGLTPVPTSSWGGLLVTLVVAMTGIVISLPLGITLAMARRSELPVVSLLAIVFIEFWRGVPLITVLFFATYLLPLFLPDGWSTEPLLRVLLGVALFAAAYMAEVVRGGLQAIPRGQSEAAKALGLGSWRTARFVVLPQAIRHVIPGIVNTFIGLFKDTTLVMTVSIFDFLGQLRAAFADPNWATPATLFTGFAFAGAIYFIFCFGMSRYSLFVERRLAFNRSGRT